MQNVYLFCLCLSFRIKVKKRYLLLKKKSGIFSYRVNDILTSILSTLKRKRGTLFFGFKRSPSSDTQGQLVGSIKCSWWKFTVRSRQPPGHLLLPTQFQKRLNCLLLIGRKNVFLANQWRETAGWLSCFLTRRSFPHLSP